jgi:hypothetical protein
LLRLSFVNHVLSGTYSNFTYNINHCRWQRYWQDDRGTIPGRAENFLFLPKSTRTVRHTQLPIPIGTVGSLFGEDGAEGSK